MVDYHIFLSCNTKIELNCKEMIDYIETIDFPDDVRKNKLRKILMSKNTILLQDFLNELLKPLANIIVNTTPSEVIHSKRRLEKIKYKPETGQPGKYKSNALFIINLEDNRDPSRISYWELGYASAKNQRIIGYRCNSSIPITDNKLTYCIEDKTIITNVHEFMTKVYDSLNSWGIKAPNPEYFEERWENVGRLTK